MPMNRNESGGFFADINITPLTDIFLVLLIIFMVTTAVTIESAAHIDLPKPPSVSKLTPEKPKRTVVTYTAEHLIYVNGEQVTERQLVPQLHEALQSSPDKIVIFQGDPKLRVADMVRILDLAKLAGAKDITIAVSSVPSSRPAQASSDGA